MLARELLPMEIVPYLSDLDISGDWRGLNYFTGGTFYTKKTKIRDVYKRRCEICKKYYVEGLLIYFTRKTREICNANECIITGNCYTCSHKKDIEYKNYLAGLVCSEECFNMFVFRRGVR